MALCLMLVTVSSVSSYVEEAADVRAPPLPNATREEARRTADDYGPAPDSAILINYIQARITLPSPTEVTPLTALPCMRCRHSAERVPP